MPITFTELTNKQGVIAKKYSSENGKTVVTPAANVYDATGKTLVLEETEVATYLDSMAEENSKAIVLGVWPDAEGQWEEFDIVTNNDERLDPSAGIISRSTSYFQYANHDQVSLMYLDFDSESEDRQLFFDE